VCTEITGEFTVHSARNTTSFSQIVVKYLLKPRTSVHCIFRISGQ